MDYLSTFFKSKKPWSYAKDDVLRFYLKPYLQKLATRRQPIVIVDAFAGRGEFGETPGEGEPGSPVIIAESIRDFAPNQARALFFNNRRQDHDDLGAVLEQRGLSEFGERRHGDAKHLLADFAREEAANASVFVYQDPCGVSGLSFEPMTKLLARQRASTEFLINMRSSALHRMAAQNWIEIEEYSDIWLEAVRDLNLDSDDEDLTYLSEAEFESEEPDFDIKIDPTSQQVDRWHSTLNEVFGGDYWREYLLDVSTEPQERVAGALQAYCRAFRKWKHFAGSCEIRRHAGANPLHVLTFCSSHPHGILIMNDAMCRATRKHEYAVSVAGTMFEGVEWESLDKSAVRRVAPLIEAIVVEDGPIRRRDIELSVAVSNFSQFTMTEVRRAVAGMVKEGELVDLSGSGLNNESRLVVKQRQMF